jgi:hypothetical protein
MTIFPTPRATRRDCHLVTAPALPRRQIRPNGRHADTAALIRQIPAVHSRHRNTARPADGHPGAHLPGPCRRSRAHHARRGTSPGGRTRHHEHRLATRRFTQSRQVGSIKLDLVTVVASFHWTDRDSLLAARRAHRPYRREFVPAARCADAVVTAMLLDRGRRGQRHRSRRSITTGPERHHHRHPHALSRHRTPGWIRHPQSSGGTARRRPPPKPFSHRGHPHRGPHLYPPPCTSMSHMVPW